MVGAAVFDEVEAFAARALFVSARAFFDVDRAIEAHAEPEAGQAHGCR